MEEEYIIAPAGREHIAAIEALESECFSLPCTAKMIEDHLDRYTVLLSGNALAGYRCVSSVLDEGSLDNIAIRPELRGRGLSKRLMDDMIVRAREAGLAVIQLEVRESNAPAIALYEHYGFRTDGKRKNYYTKPREDAILMTLVL